jgi:phosphatidylinositol-3-phosphatase
MARLRRMPARRVATLLAFSVVTLLAATPSASAAPAALPKPDHVLIVFMENKDTDEILGSKDAPYLNALAASGASFTNAHAETHPSQPNYIAMFSGGTQGVTDDGCDHSFEAPNLGSELIAAGHTFVGYAEGLPAAGSGVCTAGRYARKHSPWVNFRNLPPTANQPASALRSWDQLPTVAFLTPDMCHDMHDCPVAAGDAWAKQTLGSYTTWARTHNSLLILTFDESETHTRGNPIATILAGPMVVPGEYPARIDHYSLLRTIEDMYGLPPLGHSAESTPIAGIWHAGSAEGGASARPGAAIRAASSGR